jgi:hypothetical protein
MCYEILSKLKFGLMHCNHILTQSRFNWDGLSTILFTQVSSSQIYNLTNRSINWKLKVRSSRRQPPCHPPLHPHLPESGPGTTRSRLGGRGGSRACGGARPRPRVTHHGARCRAQRLGHAPWSARLRRNSSPSRTSTRYSPRSPYPQPLLHAMDTMEAPPLAEPLARTSSSLLLPGPCFRTSAEEPRFTSDLSAQLPAEEQF